MLGLGLGLSLAFRPASPGPAPAGHLRIVPNGATSAYIIAPHAMGALAYELTLGNGADESTPPSSIGAPYGGWRWTGTHHLAAVTDDPTAPIATMHQDIGSVDAAMQANFGASLFGGHYHGGIVLASSEMPDLTTERYVSSFSFGYTATITWPTGETADVVYQLAIQADGNMAGSMTYDSEAVFTRAFLSMMIGNAFTHFSTDGETWTDARAAGNYPLGSAAGVIMRQGDTGYEIEVSTDQLAESEVSEGKAALIGSATAATFDPETGSGSVTRSTLANQSYVLWDDLAPNAQYSVVIENTGTNELTVRTGPAATYQGPGTGWVAGAAAFAIPAGAMIEGIVTTDGQGDASLTITSNSQSSTFTVHQLARILNSGVTNEIVNNGGRLKHYVRKTSAGGPLGTVSLGRTIAFRKTEPDPPPEDLFHWLGSRDGETWLEVPTSAAVYLDAGECVLERGTHTSVAYHRAIWEMAGLEPETTYRLPIVATAEGSDSAGCWIDIILSSNGSTTGARASDFLKDAMDRGYIDFTTDVGQTTLYAMIRQQPLADSVEVARVSELGPLEVAP